MYFLLRVEGVVVLKEPLTYEAVVEVLEEPEQSGISMFLRVRL